jgi:hypothetical protein
MELYQVFQSSYNKITKTDYANSPDTAASAAAFTSDMYAADSRFFPFDTRPGAAVGNNAVGALKCDKAEMAADPRQWYTDPSSGMYSDPALYYHTAPPDQEWGSAAAYHPQAHYSPDPLAYTNSSVAAYGASAPIAAAVSPPAVASSPGPYSRSSAPPLDDAINVFRNHLDFTQVRYIYTTARYCLHVFIEMQLIVPTAPENLGWFQYRSPSYRET